MTDRGSDSSSSESDRTDNRPDDAVSDSPREAGSNAPSESESDTPPESEPSDPRASASDAPQDSTSQSDRSSSRTGESENSGTATERPRSRSPTPPAREASSRPGEESVSIEDDGIIRWFLKTESGAVVYVRDIVSSVGLVMLVALILFGVSGVWPPLVAVESGSMEPNMQRGDMIFVVEDERFVGDGAIEGTGIVTRSVAAETGHDKFGNPGDVIIFRPGGSEQKVPVIHRAQFWVEADENWVETKANPAYLDDATCDELASCPAPDAGFVTKGDANGGYDQHPRYGASPSTIVKPAWVEGKAAYRIPWLGHIRLTFDEVFSGEGTPAGTAPVVALVGGFLISRRPT